MKSENVFLDGPAGRLEGVLDMQRAARPRAMAVVCHPHPQYEGTLHNKVAFTLARAAVESGAVALRFNFRGVGKSTGSYGEGRGELEDFQAAERWMSEHYGDLPRWRLGFSFGAAIVLNASLDAGCDALVTVAPPAGRLGDYGLEREGRPEARHWLLAQGDADEVVSARATLDWARAFDAPPEIAVFEGVGHFFHGHLTALRKKVRAMLEATIEEQR
jgi:alpha/beta superfamily hydrolase